MPADAPSGFTVDDVRRAAARHAPQKVPWMGRPAAVLVPVFERDGRLHLVLTKRTDALPTHAGQVSFPGGKREEADRDLHHTALRETHEELGIDPAVVTIVGELDDCPTVVSNFVITPVVGIIPGGLKYAPNPGEIAVILEPALDDFLRPDALRTERHEHDGVQYDMYFYDVGGQIVWGATARIIHGLFRLLLRDR